MKILVVAQSMPPESVSGATLAFSALVAEGQSRQELRLITGFHQRREGVAPGALAVDLGGLSPGWSWWRMSRAMAQESRRFEAEAAVLLGVDVPASPVPAVRWIADLPHGGDEAWPEALARWGQLRRARRDPVVVPSRGVREKLLRAGFGASRVFEVDPPLDLTRLGPVSERSAPGEVLQVVHPGRIAPGKGQHLSIDAVARLGAAERGRVRLVVAGTCGDPLYLSQLRIAARGLPVEFKVDVAELGAELRAADLVVLPTLEPRSFGWVGLEALALERPLVWSDLSNLRETLGGFGTPVRPGDVADLRSKIAQALRDPSALQGAVAGGRREVARRFDPAQSWSRVEALIRR